MSNHVITTIRDLLESDEQLRKMIRRGLLDKLENQGDPKVWERVIKLLYRQGAYLTILPDDRIWSSGIHTYYITRFRHIPGVRDSATSHWRVDYSGLKVPQLQGLSWPFSYLTRYPGPGVAGAPGQGRLRKFTFDYVMMTDV